MNLPAPFAYPTRPHTRRHGPCGYQKYQQYKPFLRDDFGFRCVYCLEREIWYPNRAASFAVDHFEPKAKNPDREHDYENMVYACNRCNSLKREVIPHLDPTRVALDQHLRVLDDGQIEGLTPEGQKLIALLDLAHEPAVQVRNEALLILRAKRARPCDPVIHEIFLKRFGYPIELPDLRKLEPPGGNSRPGGIDDSHYERQTRGELPEFY
jgi:hypothetical protein